VNHCCLLM